MALLKFIRHNGLTLYSSFSNGFINVSLFDFQPCTWNGKLTFGGLLLMKARCGLALSKGIRVC